MSGWMGGSVGIDGWGNRLYVADICGYTEWEVGRIDRRNEWVGGRII